MRKILISLVFLLLVNFLYGGGFQVNLQCTRTLGMGHAGTALTLGPSSVFFNPGAITFTTPGVQGGASLVFANISISEHAPAQTTYNNLPNTGTPFGLYATEKINDKLFFGLGVYTPFGSTIEYPANWFGRFALTKMALKTIFFQPTVAYKISDKISLGASYVLATGSVSLDKDIPAQFSDGTYASANLSSSARGHGFTGGIYFEATEKLSIGLSHRSSIKVQTNGGIATFNVPEALEEFFPKTGFNTTLNLPSTTSLGFAYKHTEKLTLTAELNYVTWSVYDTLGFDFEINTDRLEDQASPRLYSNSFIYRLGAQYELNEKLQLRAGAYFDMTPVGDDYITPESPDVNKIGFTTGLTYTISEKFKLEAAFLYLEGMKRTATNAETQFGGTFKSRAFIPSFSFNYIF
jgi:long-chain fatty acid transport protein